MKTTGMVRGIDPLGRIVIPMELRRNLDIKEHDSIEIFTEGDTIILKKHRIGCVFCGKESQLTYKGVAICEKCATSVSSGSIKKDPHRVEDGKGA